jgi:hypothetical protein
MAGREKYGTVLINLTDEANSLILVDDHYETDSCDK